MSFKLRDLLQSRGPNTYASFLDQENALNGRGSLEDTREEANPLEPEPDADIDDTDLAMAPARPRNLFGRR